MATAATSLLGLALPVTGELSGTWGDTVNISITALLDTAVAGTTTLSSDADVTLTTTTLAANQARQAIILWTAGGTATRTITVPAQSKSYIVINKTSSSQSIKIVGAGPTTGVTIVAGTAALVVWNGVDFVTASVTSTTGVLPVANGGTGLTSGTSGGVLAYTATGTLASSTALAASALVIGGGAGAAPSTTTTGTGVVTALGVNTGTAGAFVVNGGALGTPSSGTVTNLTGTASININGTVGATTATTGAFTTVSATTTASSAAVTINGTNAVGGTFFLVQRSGVAKSYFGSSVSISGVGTANDTDIYAVGDGRLFGGDQTTNFTKFTSTGLAVTGTLSATGTLSGGTSGTAYSFSGSAPATSLTLNSSGNLGIGTSSPTSKLQVGTGAATSTVQAQFLGGVTVFENSGATTSVPTITFNSDLDTGINNPGANLLALYTGGTERARIDTSGNLTISTGNLVIGTSGKGIDFSATAGTGTSELLADYEEGTWTPTYVSSGATFGYTQQFGSYVKIGKLVYAQFYLNVTASGTTTNQVTVSGLPFTSTSVNNPFEQGFGGAWSSNTQAVAFTVDPNATTVTMWKQNTAPTTAIANNVVGYQVGTIIYQSA